MAEIGLLNGEMPVELIEGEIIQMAPMGTQHGQVVERLHQALAASLQDRVLINIQRVFRLSSITEAQPDISVLRPQWNQLESSFPTGEDTLLVIEVSDNTLLYDQDIKLPVYAAHGVPEVWIVDLESRCVRFFRALRQGWYTDIRTTGAPGFAALVEFPDQPIDLTDVLTYSS